MTDHDPGTIPDDLSALIDTTRIRVAVVSYGEGHQDPPDDLYALTVNLVDALRNPPDDPAARTRLAALTGLDKQVRAYVMATRGAHDLADDACARIHALLLGYAEQRGKLVVVHVKCWGGRHRSVAIAEEVAARLRADGIGVEVEHRHLDKPLLPSRPKAQR